MFLTWTGVSCTGRGARPSLVAACGGVVAFAVPRARRDEVDAAVWEGAGWAAESGVWSSDEACACAATTSSSLPSSEAECGDAGRAIRGTCICTRAGADEPVSSTPARERGSRTSRGAHLALALALCPSPTRSGSTLRSLSLLAMRRRRVRRERERVPGPVSALVVRVDQDGPKRRRRLVDARRKVCHRSRLSDRAGKRERDASGASRRGQERDKQQSRGGARGQRARCRSQTRWARWVALVGSTRAGHRRRRRPRQPRRAGAWTSARKRVPGRAVPRRPRRPRRPRGRTRVASLAMRASWTCSRVWACAQAGERSRRPGRVMRVPGRRARPGRPGRVPPRGESSSCDRCLR